MSLSTDLPDFSTFTLLGSRNSNGDITLSESLANYKLLTFCQCGTSIDGPTVPTTIPVGLFKTFNNSTKRVVMNISTNAQTEFYYKDDNTITLSSVEANRSLYVYGIK